MIEIVAGVHPVKGKFFLRFQEPLSIDLSLGVPILGELKGIIVQMYAKQKGWT